VKDIERQKGHLNHTLMKYQDLLSLTGEGAPVNSTKVINDINHLHHDALEQRNQLQMSLVQHEAYQTEISDLSQLITTTLERDVDNPVRISSFDGIQQIARQNVCKKIFFELIDF
jgi:hypothetical protein